MVITSNGGYRGNKTIDIIDDALLNCPCVENVLVVKKSVQLSQCEGRDQWLNLFLTICDQGNYGCRRSTILYTSGSTDETKRNGYILQQGYMVYTAILTKTYLIQRQYFN
jgi:acetyl-CoA synthetase